MNESRGCQRLGFCVGRHQEAGRPNGPSPSGPREPAMSELKKVTIYTDGGCIRNPGPGGYAAVLLFGQHRKELSGGFRQTTNNRMEIMAALEGLRVLKNSCEVMLWTDSQY